MKTRVCDKCRRTSKQGFWPLNFGLIHYDICWDCKPIIEAFITTNNDATAGNSLETQEAK